MNEDLHNIDDLFRNSLGEYSEQASPSVWERVNNDLDKKQAFYYKGKYRRLKRGAFVLLLLCVLGVSYIVFSLLNDKPASLVRKKDDVTMRSFQEKDKSHENVVNKSNGVQKNNIEERGKTDTRSGTAPGFSRTKGAKKPTGKATNNSSLIFSSQPADNRTTKEMTFTNGRIAKEKQMRTYEPLITNQYITSRSFSLERLPFMNNFYTNLMIMARSLSVNHRTISPQTSAQSPIKSKVKTVHGFSVSGFVAPDFSFDRFEDDPRLSRPGRNREDAHKNEHKNISFTGGLLLTYELATKIGLQSGISFTSSSTSIKPETVYAKADNNGHTQYELHCSSGYAYISPKGNVQPAVGDSAKASGTTSRLTYVSIPISINYRITKRRLSLSPSIGAAVNILSGGKTKTILSNPGGSEITSASISGLKSTYMNWQIGLGAQYPLSQKLAISIRPIAKFALNAINKETPVKSYQNLLSVETGVQMKL